MSTGVEGTSQSPYNLLQTPSTSLSHTPHSHSESITPRRWPVTDNATNHRTDNSTYDVASLLRLHLGPRHRSDVETCVLVIVYVIIFTTGVIGNICTCFVIMRNKRMHTATNYYLFSLAVSDLLTLLLGLPPELYSIIEAYPWRFGQPYCLFKTFLTEMTSSASILTITAFTIERYLAICHSFRAQATSGLTRALRSIIFIWAIACLAALPYPLHTRTFYYVKDKIGEDLPESLICNIPAVWVYNMRYIFQLSTFLLFVLPMVLISVLYVQIGLALRRSENACSDWTSGGLTGQRPVTSRAHSRKAVFKMLVAVVVAFCLCWAPFHAQRLMTVYFPEDQWSVAWLEMQAILFYISGVLYFVSSTVNPLLYNLMSRNYRQAFKITLCYRCLDDASRQRLRYGGTTAGGAYCSSVYLSDRQTRGAGVWGYHRGSRDVGGGGRSPCGRGPNGEAESCFVERKPSSAAMTSFAHELLNASPVPMMSSSMDGFQREECVEYLRIPGREEEDERSSEGSTTPLVSGENNHCQHPAPTAMRGRHRRSNTERENRGRVERKSLYGRPKSTAD